MPKKVLSFEESFASHPKAKYWSKKNVVLPKDVSKWSKDKYYFYCNKCNHIILQSLCEITSKIGNRCIYCAGQKLCGEDTCNFCLIKSFAVHPKAKYWSKVNELFPKNVFVTSNKKYYFTCDICNHDFDMILSNFTNQNQSCPYCANFRLCGEGNCKMCIDKSFATHPKSKEWSIKNPVLAINVFKNSGDKFLFNCSVCKHVYEMSPHHLSDGKTCSYCTNKKLCTDNNCDICYKKSFLSNPYSKNWSLDNKIHPRYVFKCSHKSYIFNCNICHHTFNASVLSIDPKAINCSFCTNKSLCDNNDCKKCEEKSFVLHPKAKYWSDKNTVKPRQVFKSSGKKYLFDCNNCNEIYISTTANITDGSWCGCEKFKTEKKLYDYLKSICTIQVYKQKTFPWCKNKKLLPFDFFIENLNLIIELDGLQHFQKIAYWLSTPEEIQKNDKYKMDIANKNGYSVIRIFQVDVWEDKNNWKETLTNAIKKYDEVTNIFIGNIYNNTLLK